MNEAKSAGLIPTFAPSNPNGGGTPYYAAGTDTGPGGVCSWTGELRNIWRKTREPRKALT